MTNAALRDQDLVEPFTLLERVSDETVELDLRQLTRLPALVGAMIVSRLGLRGGRNVVVQSPAAELGLGSVVLASAVARYTGRAQPEEPAELTPAGVFVPALEVGNLEVDDFDRLLVRVWTWMEHLQLRPRLPNARVRALAQLAFELAQNVFDHASRNPLPRSTPIHSFLALELRENALELVVSDDGVGIAARQSGGGVDERDAFREAFQPGRSAKKRVSDAPMRGDPGYGYLNFMASLAALGGSATVWSGRQVLTMLGRESEHRTRPGPSLAGTTAQVRLPLG